MRVNEAAATRRAIEDAELAIAKAYAVIDRGDDVSDLTAPGAVKRIREMDRLGLTYETPMYLTYPEDVDAGDWKDPSDDVVDDDDDDDDDDDKLDLTPTAIALKRAEALPLVASQKTMGHLTISTKRPARRVEYDVSVGVGPEPRVDDREKDETAHAFDSDGNVSDAAYRDLDAID